MTRARKMYQAIEMILTIIKLLDKLKSIETPATSPMKANLLGETLLPSTSPASRRFNANPALVKNLKARIRCHIKSFLAQHTLFPVQFIYGGVDQLTALKTQDNRAETRLSGDSRIINLRLGGSQASRRSSTRSGQSRSQSALKSQKSTKSKSNKPAKRA